MYVFKILLECLKELLDHDTEVDGGKYNLVQDSPSADIC